jgi:hypothetical protein
MSESATIVDFIARAADSSVLLILIDDQPWDGSTARIAGLQEKIQGYAAYVTDGGLIRDHPELSGFPVRIELRCVHHPDPLTAHILSALHDVLVEHGMTLSVKQIRVTSPRSPRN